MVLFMKARLWEKILKCVSPFYFFSIKVGVGKATLNIWTKKKKIQSEFSTQIASPKQIQIGQHKW